MNTQENNKLIAEFMGLIIRDKEGNLPTSSQQHKLFIEEEWDKLYLASPYSPNGPDYHKEWNWLMPVVDKIECTPIDNNDNSDNFFNVMIEIFECNINGGDICICKSGHTKREATYNAVVEFINQYNKNK